MSEQDESSIVRPVWKEIKMLNVKIWIRNPYPFHWNETQALEEALRKTYGSNPTYFKECPVAYVEAENVTMTTAKNMAATIKAINLQYAINDRKSGGRVLAEDVEVEVRGRLDERPEWAKVE